MRICFISLGTFPHVVPYLDYFKEAGHDVHFIALSPPAEHRVPTYNVAVGKRYSANEGKWKYPISMIRARRLIKRLKPDILHTHYATSGGLAGLICGFHPTIVTVHGSDLTMGIKSRIWRPLLKVIFSHSDCINTVSEDLKDMVLGLNVCCDKVEVLTLGVDVVKFSFVERDSIDKNRPLKLVCTRHLKAVYDHPTIIKAMAILKNEGLSFEMTFVGDGVLRHELEQLIRYYDLQEQITFLGAVENDKLPQILSEHDIYLSASLWDGTSISLLEAMSTGLFPIVSNIKANSAWLQHGVSGFLHKVSEPDDLARYILQLYKNPKLAFEAAKRNRKKVLNLADRKANMRRLEELYIRLVETAP